MKIKHLILMILVLPVCGQLQAQSPILVNQVSETKKEFFYEVANEYDHNVLQKIYMYNTKADSFLKIEREVYYSPEMERTFYNGVSKAYNSSGKVVLEEFYMLNEVYKSSVSVYGEDVYMGQKTLQIPLLELKKPQHKATNYMQRLNTEPYMFTQPSGECFDFNTFEYTFTQTGDCQESSTWWLPNLLTTEDTSYKYAMGVEFEMVFTPQTAEKTFPYQIMIGNSPSGYYYVTIRKSGMISLGVRTSESDGWRDVLNVSKATRITFGEENRIRIRLLSNGHYYLEFNDYTQGYSLLNFEIEEEGTDQDADIGQINGVSNRILASGNMDIERLYLGMFQFVVEEKDMRPYNSMYRADIKELTDVFAENLIGSTGEAELTNTDLYLTSFQAGSEGRDNELNLACNIGFNMQGEESHRTIWFKYYLDPDSNAIKKVSAVIGGETLSWSAKEFYDLLPASSRPDGFAYENGMISHRNSR